MKVLAEFPSSAEGLHDHVVMHSFSRIGVLRKEEALAKRVGARTQKKHCLEKDNKKKQKQNDE